MRERWRVVVAFLDAYGPLINATSTIVIALFTLALFVATLLLWVAIRNLVEGSSDTSERQLRAYVTLAGGQMRIVNLTGGGLGVSIDIELKNSGQTPAYGFTTWVRPPEVHDKDAVPFGPPTPLSERTGSSIVGSGANVTVNYTIPLTDQDAINNGSKRIFVWGGADYTDAFGVARYFHFRSASGPSIVNVDATGRINWQGWSLQPHRLGYEAN